MYQDQVSSFQKLREESVILIKELKDLGKKVVGIYCTFCPSELVTAAGAIPVGLCGTREEPISSAEEVLPRNLCPLIKSSYGFAATDTCPFFYFSDLVIGETTCDGKKKMFEILGEIKPVYVMQLPHKRESQASFDLWVDEIRRLRDYLEKQLGTTISDESLWSAIDERNREVQALKDIFDLNQPDPPPLTGSELLNVAWSKKFITEKENSIYMLGKLKEDIMHHKEAASAITDKACAKGKPRVLLTGCPVGVGSEKVIKLVEELGGTVVAMENCSGYKTLGLKTSKSYDDPIVALAHKYIQIPCSCMSPNSHRIELLEQMISDFSVDAVIDLTWQACHTYNIEAYEVGKTVRKNNLPYLHLESDYSSSDLETLRVRIEAMLEMVS